MSAVRFGEIRHLDDLARAFGTTVEAIQRFGDPAVRAACYRPIRLRKKGKRLRGQFRTVYKVQQELKLLQANIATTVAEVAPFGDHVQGFVSKRSVVTNARVHLGQKVLLHADIHHFFESITRAQVESAFQSIGCRPAVAPALADICTLDERLPEGSSASPVIANLVARYLDADLKNLALAHGCQYTRYADDITISGSVVPDVALVEGLVRQHGFELREGGAWTQRRGKSQYVTGLTIADPRSPRVPRLIKRRLRLELHYATKFGLNSHLRQTESAQTWGQAIRRLGGWISFMSSVEGKEATAGLYRRWQALVERGAADEPPPG